MRQAEEILGLIESGYSKKLQNIVLVNSCFVFVLKPSCIKLSWTCHSTNKKQRKRFEYQTLQLSGNEQEE